MNHGRQGKLQWWEHGSILIDSACPTILECVSTMCNTGTWCIRFLHVEMYSGQCAALACKICLYYVYNTGFNYDGWLLFVSPSNNFTGHGQITLRQTNTAQEVAIEVIENQSVTFVCETFATLGTRFPGSPNFVINPPPNLVVRGELTTGLFTFEFQNVTRNDNGLHFSVLVGEVLLTSVSSSCCVSCHSYGFMCTDLTAHVLYM